MTVAICEWSWSLAWLCSDLKWIFLLIRVPAADAKSSQVKPLVLISPDSCR